MRRLITAGALALVALIGTASPALAHNVLVGSDPADGAQVRTGPKEVRLNFDQPVKAGDEYNAVTVIGPNGGHWTAGPARVESNAVIAPVRDLGPAGSYTVGYRVLSNDGHPVSGKVGFTLTAAGSGTPGQQPSATASPEQSESGSSGMPVWPWIAGAAVLVLLGLGLALRLGKPKS
ncbi:copper resistance protein CopC [Saccharopolyspora halophila]|uniref:Copper resistance protein CopC n=1 Tax=Saccharopolyspora halophila TaxID=405551 RepID=A0ABN3FNN0_9PSEU